MRSSLKFFSFLFALTLVMSCGGGGGEDTGGGGGGDLSLIHISEPTRPY